MALNGYMFGFALSVDESDLDGERAEEEGVLESGRWSTSLVDRFGLRDRSDLDEECANAAGAELWLCSRESSLFLRTIDSGLQCSPTALSGPCGAAPDPLQDTFLRNCVVCARDGG
jgi:hypothetical protein